MTSDPLALVVALGARCRALILVRMVLMHELSVAIAAFDLTIGPEFQIDHRVTQRATAAIAGDLVTIDIDDFRRRNGAHRHKAQLTQGGWPSLTESRAARQMNKAPPPRFSEGAGGKGVISVRGDAPTRIREPPH